jgi:ABC-2 type transport system ATP-binding protein
MQDNGSAVEARGLTKQYGSLTAVSNVSFDVRPGQIVGYIGPNGSGKSTTVGMLVGTIEPTRGIVLFGGEDIRDNLLDYRRFVGYVPELPRLYPFLSGAEHVELIGRLREIPGPVLTKRRDELLALFDLEDAAHQAIATYSKGMRQRVLLIQALLHNPPVVFLDEPLSGLDVPAANVVRHLLVALARLGKAILYSSHVLEIVEKVCTHVIVLNRGEVVAHDEVNHLTQAHGGRSLADVFAELVSADDARTRAEHIAGVITECW